MLKLLWIVSLKQLSPTTQDANMFVSGWGKAISQTPYPFGYDPLPLCAHCFIPCVKDGGSISVSNTALLKFATVIYPHGVLLDTLHESRVGDLDNMYNFSYGTPRIVRVCG